MTSIEKNKFFEELFYQNEQLRKNLFTQAVNVYN